MSFKEVRAKWNKMTQGWFGTVIYIFLGFILAFGMIQVFGIALHTTAPVVSVVSCSMEHKSNSLCQYSLLPSSGNSLCNNVVTDYDGSFDSYWNVCGKWYEDSGITKEQFGDFRFTDGLPLGDMLIIYNDGDYKVGDIIVYQGNRAQPIIHRIVSVDGDTVTTKGDRNPIPDSAAVPKSAIRGRAVASLPLLGWVKLLFTKITHLA